MIDKLKSLIQDKNPKIFAKLIKQDIDICSFVSDFQTKWDITNVNEAIWCILNNTDPELCKCGNRKPFNSYVHGYRLYCNNSCTARKQDHSEKITKVWHDPDKLAAMVEKRNQTNITRYGVTNPATLECIKQKTRNTNLDRYGAETPFASDIVQDKIKSTNMKKYGVANAINNPEIKEKYKNTLLMKYGVDNPSKVPEIKDRATDSMIKTKKKNGTIKTFDGKTRPETASLSISNSTGAAGKSKDWVNAG
jgi:hypothetical protein